MKKILPLLKKMTFSQWVLVLVVLLAAFLRFYNLRGSLQFQGDQGRDAIIVADIFRKRDPVFIGPVTSVGNMYLGPLYYYFMLPFLFLSYPSPMGPVYAIATLGLLTVFLMYMVGKKLVSKRAAYIATIFYTFSAVVITNTRFSWNPNPAPFVSLLMIFFTKKAWDDHPKYWVWVSVCFSILIQLHYLTLLSLGGAGLIWLFQGTSLFQQKQKNKNFVKQIKVFAWSTILAILVFLTSLTPLLLFDLKHDDLNKNAFISLLTEKETFKQSAKLPLLKKASAILAETEGRGMHVLFEISIGKNRQLNRFLLYTFGFILLWMFLLQNKEKSQKNDPHHSGKVVILSYLFTGILGTALYQHTIFDHYIAYLFPVTFLIYGIIFDVVWRSFFGKVFFAVFFVFFLWYNLPKLPLRTLGWTVDDVKKTSEAIYSRVQENERYNIVLLSESKDHYGQNYRYFLTTFSPPPQEVGENDSLDTLYIIDEEKKAENPVDLPIYDIVVFSNKNVAETFSINNGPNILVLRK